MTIVLNLLWNFRIVFAAISFSTAEHLTKTFFYECSRNYCPFSKVISYYTSKNSQARWLMVFKNFSSPNAQFVGKKHFLLNYLKLLWCNTFCKKRFLLSSTTLKPSKLVNIHFLFLNDS